MEAKYRSSRAFALLAISLVVLLTAFSCAGAEQKQVISSDYNVCAIGMTKFDVSRYDIIDVEKVEITRNGVVLEEFVFNEMGIGSYNKMIQETGQKGVTMRDASDIVVYGELFQADRLFFIAKSLQPGRSPVWIYAKFFGQRTIEGQSAAMKMMSSLSSCD